MSGCCNHDCKLEQLRQRQRGTLRAVLGITAVMFVVIAWAAVSSDSSVLLSDCLDNLGDAMTYGLSLFAVSMDAPAKARVALFKGGLIFQARPVCFDRSISAIRLSRDPPSLAYGWPL